MKRAIGISTGILYRSIPSISQQIMNVCGSLCIDAVELGCIRTKSLLELPNFTVPDNRSQFNYFSLHAPTDLIYRDDEETKQVLDVIKKTHKRLHFDLVVIHPDIVKDWSVLEDMSFPIGVENSDWRKDFGKTVEDLEKVFLSNRTDFGFVLDVNHCFTNDRSMKLAEELIAQFSDRLCEIHLSGFTNYHEPISVTQQMEILKAVPFGDIPIIIESVCADEEEVWKEYNYIKNYLEINREKEE